MCEENDVNNVGGNADWFLSAPVTPFDDEGNVNYGAIARLAALEKSFGVDCIWVVGGCGQWSSLTVGERKKLADVWVKEGGKVNLKVIVHVGGQSIEECKELAAHAEAIGADGIVAYPPFAPHKPKDMNTLVKCLQQLTSAAPKTDFYYYHIPHVTGVDFPMLQLLERAELELPTLKGIKYVAWTLADFHRCVIYKEKKFNMMWAMNPKLSAIFTGCRSWVLAQAYLTPPLSKLLKHYRSSSNSSTDGIADHLTRRFDDLLEILHGPKYMGEQVAAKATFSFYGIDCKSPRLPLLGLSPSQMENLRSDLKEFSDILPPFTDKQSVGDDDDDISKDGNTNNHNKKRKI